jgi:23S rRNA (adenine2030-N6)-methyltransferase
VNYRHSFHAGNFADLVKHAALLAVLSRSLEDPSPVLVVDTHAGAGQYDLTAIDAARSREAEAGVSRLAGAELPPALQALARAVAARNGAGAVRIYPGSPALALDRLRPQDSFVGCELRPDDHARLQSLVARSGKRGQALLTDGFDKAAVLAETRPERLVCLIDLPFERADDYVRIAETLEAVLAAKPEAQVLVWLPLKDLETFDGFLRRLEPFLPGETLVAETRLRPLHDPLRLNGCVLIAIKAGAAAEADIAEASAFVVKHLGDPGGRAKLWRLAD